MKDDTVLYDKRKKTVEDIIQKREGPMFSRKDVTYYKLSGIPELVKSNQVKKVPREKFDTKAIMSKSNVKSRYPGKI